MAILILVIYMLIHFCFGHCICILGGVNDRPRCFASLTPPNIQMFLHQAGMNRCGLWAISLTSSRISIWWQLNSWRLHAFSPGGASFWPDFASFWLVFPHLACLALLFYLPCAFL